MCGPLNRLAGSGLAREGFIVGFDPHETGRYGGTAYWGCLVPAGGFLLVGAGWVLWAAGRWRVLPLSIGG